MAGVGSASGRTSLLSSLSFKRDPGLLGEVVAALPALGSDLVDSLPGALETAPPDLPGPVLEDVPALPDMLGC